MTEEEIVDVDLDVVNLLKKLPKTKGYAHCYFNSTETAVSGCGNGSIEDLTALFYDSLQYGNEERAWVKTAMIDAVLNHLIHDYDDDQRKTIAKLIKPKKNK